MRLLIAILVLAFSLPAAAAQDAKAEKKTEKKAEKKKAPAKKIEKKEKTQAQPKQDWGRFNSQATKDEKDRTQAAAQKK